MSKWTQLTVVLTTCLLMGVQGFASILGAGDADLSAIQVYDFSGQKINFNYNVAKNYQESAVDFPSFVKVGDSDLEIQTTLVTQLQYFNLMGDNPAENFQKSLITCRKKYMKLDGLSFCPDRPIESDNRNVINHLISQLNKTDDVYMYRLLAKEEWKQHVLSLKLLGNHEYKLYEGEWIDQGVIVSLDGETTWENNTEAKKERYTGFRLARTRKEAVDK